MSLRFVPVRYDDALAEIAWARSEAFPDMPVSESELARQLLTRPKELFRHVELIHMDGQFAGYWTLYQDEMFANEGEMTLRVTLRPPYAGQGVEPEALDRGVELARARNAATVLSVARSTDPDYCSALENLGFEERHRDILSTLELRTFVPTAWSDAIAKVRDKGITIASGDELERTTPDWLKRAYEQHTELMRDVPFASHYTPPTFDQWSARVRDPMLHDTRLMFLAEMDGQFVGETTLFRLESHPNVCLTGLTAVRASHRRQGIAIALKVHSILEAGKLGVERIETGNEKNNPAYVMNRRLGYVDRCDSIGFALELARSSSV